MLDNLSTEVQQSFQNSSGAFSYESFSFTHKDVIDHEQGGSSILVPTTPELHPKCNMPQLTPHSKLESLKSWGVSTYKCTKQMLAEKMGKCSRTVDTELELQIEILRDTQRKYQNILCLSRAMTSHFYHLIQTQGSLAECFSDLAQKSPELQEEFLYNSETQKCLTRNGDGLLAALNFFVSSLNTLCNKTIEDTLKTVHQYETSRLEYDAYRNDLELLKQQRPIHEENFKEVEDNYNVKKKVFERLRSDVSTKLRFLHENRVKVMHKQLLLFNNAISAYFAGNQKNFDTVLKQFNISVENCNNDSNSWLEH